MMWEGKSLMISKQRISSGNGKPDTEHYLSLAQEIERAKSDECVVSIRFLGGFGHKELVGWIEGIDQQLRRLEIVTEHGPAWAVLDHIHTITRLSVDQE
jgi:hypothetical protein